MRIMTGKRQRKTEIKTKQTQTNPNSLANLKPYKPGAEWTGNAGGVPKGTIFITDRARRKLADRSYDQKFEKMVDNWINRAIEANADLDALLNRTEGKVTNPVDVTGHVDIALTYKQLVELAKKEKE